MYQLIENFCLGTRRLELFGRYHSLRRGWVTATAEELNLTPEEAREKDNAAPFDRERWEAQIKESARGGKHVVPNSSGMYISSEYNYSKANRTVLQKSRVYARNRLLPVDPAVDRAAGNGASAIQTCPPCICLALPICQPTLYALQVVWALQVAAFHSALGDKRVILR